MKKWTIVLALCLLLAGCTPVDTGAPAEETKPQEETVQFYLPESAEETETKGALRAYGLAEGMEHRIYPLTDGLLLISDAADKTVVQYLTGETLEVAVQTELPAVKEDAWQIHKDQIAFARLDKTAGVYYLYDRNLQEMKTVKIPAEAVGNTCLSADFACLYYATETAIRMQNLADSTTRPIREGGTDERRIIGLAYGGTALQYHQVGANGMDNCFIHAQTGQLIHTASVDQHWYTGTERYYYQVEPNGMFFGVLGQETAHMLLPEEEMISAVAEDAGLVLIHSGTDPVKLWCIQVFEGTRIAQIQLPETVRPQTYAFSPQADYVWMLEENRLLRWQLSLSPVETETAPAETETSEN